MGLPATIAQRHSITARPRQPTPLRQPQRAPMPQRARAPLRVSGLLWGPFWQASLQSLNCHSCCRQWLTRRHGRWTKLQAWPLG